MEQLKNGIMILNVIKEFCDKFNDCENCPFYHMAYGMEEGCPFEYGFEKSPSDWAPNYSINI